MDTKQINEPFELDQYFGEYWKYFDEEQIKAVRALVENAHKIEIAQNEYGGTSFQIYTFADNMPTNVTRALYRLRKQFLFVKAFSLEVKVTGVKALLTAVIPTNEIRNPLQFIAKWAMKYTNRQF